MRTHPFPEIDTLTSYGPVKGMTWEVTLHPCLPNPAVFTAEMVSFLLFIPSPFVWLLPCISHYKNGSIGGSKSMFLSSEALESEGGYSQFLHGEREPPLGPPPSEFDNCLGIFSPGIVGSRLQPPKSSFLLPSEGLLGVSSGVLEFLRGPR